MIQVGDKLPAATLMEYVHEEGQGCPIGPNPVETQATAAGKTIALFALPGAFTPTCSAQHVMGAWAKDQACIGKVRMLGDGSAAFTQAVGLVLDLTSRGMGVRSNRYSMLVKDGVVTTLNVEGPGQFEVSDAATLLAQAKG